jgi:poly(A) polymerase Pap1
MADLIAACCDSLPNQVASYVLNRYAQILHQWQERNVLLPLVRVSAV